MFSLPSSIIILTFFLTFHDKMMINSFLRTCRPMSSTIQQKRFLSSPIFQSPPVLTSTTEKGEINRMVRMKDGKEGKIIAKSKGWYTIIINEKSLKARSSDFQILADSTMIPTPLIEQEASTEIPKQKLINIPTIPPLPLHQQCMRWIIFSDLHVKPTTIDVCEEVLTMIHQEALKREAGIIFLGDFWHVRGTVGVELLNRVLKCLHTWTQPVIMIPGNHDQVTLGGSIHGVEPLKYAFARNQALIIDEPAIYLDALWIPYRRDHELMTSILHQAPLHQDISMIFCHADVKGAWMNDGIQSRDGLDIDLFPSNLPIYSGHFHKAHTIEKNSRSLIYVGSPYQTSLSEADQQKFLYCFERQSGISDSAGASVQLRWKEVERWPISYGRKYYKLQSLDDPKINSLVRGDRLVLTIPATQLYLAEEKARALRKDGIEVEIRADMNKSLFYAAPLPLDGENPSTEKSSSEIVMTPDSLPSLLFDQNDPIQIFKQFLDIISWKEFEQNHQIIQQPFNAGTAIENNDTNNLLKEKLLKEGMTLIESFLQRNPQFSAAMASSLERKELMLSSVSLSNFGPYNQKVEYPLSKRGLVLIRGQLVDTGTGADSNGSGKTTLAMSILWCLTGSMDIRLISDSKSMEVVNDANLTEDVLSDNIAASSSSKSSSTSRKFAEVTVKGIINQKPFQITRRRYANKKQELLFQHDHQEITTPSIKETQQRIDELLGIGTGLLQRCYFYGQHSHTTQSLLGLSDSKLKEELSSFINADIWMILCSEVRALDKILKQDVTELNMKMEWKEKDYQQIEQSLREIQQSIEGMLEKNRTLSHSLTACTSSTSGQENSVLGKNNSFYGLELPLHHSYDERLQWIEKIIPQIEQKKAQLQTLSIQPLKIELETILNAQQQEQRQRFTNTPPKNNTGTYTRNKPSPARNNNANSSSQFQPQQQQQQLPPETPATKEMQLEKLKTDFSFALANQKSIHQTIQTIEKKIQEELFKRQRIENTIQTIMTRAKNQSIQNNNQSTVEGQTNSPSIIELNDYFPPNPNTGREIILKIEQFTKQINDWMTVVGSLKQQLNSIEENREHLLLHFPQLKNGHRLPSVPTADEGSGVNETCPTCGQSFLLTNPLERYQQLTNDSSLLQQQDQQHQQQITQTKRWIEQLQFLQQNLSDYSQRNTMITEYEQSKQQAEQQLSSIEQTIQSLQPTIQQLEQEIQQKQQQIMDQINTIRQQLTQSEQEYEQFTQQITALQRFYQTIKQQSEQLSQQQQKIKLEIDLLKQRLSLEEQNKERYQQQLNEIQIEISRFKQEKEALYQQSYLLNHLLLLFSTKGIQQYIFQSFLSSLELITNYYLSYLSENGIQLRLIAETANNNSSSSSSSSGSNAANVLVFDKISKLVKIRSMYSNDWKERSLSQLSGGQWRRVSLALDFGFTHLVRQRSLLRCNVMVLDEILTHLDAKGRESVGSLLKAMVTEPSAALTREEEDRKDSEGEDAEDQAIANKRKTIPSQDSFETILVILQDLAAIELEESFDHMDLVLKEGEKSRVIIDGGNDY